MSAFDLAAVASMPLYINVVIEDRRDLRKWMGAAGGSLIGWDGYKSSSSQIADRILPISSF